MRKSIFMVMLALLLAVPAFGVNKDPMKELIVASDGEFTTITAALASLPDPNTTPVVIKVMPGTYTENITMKSNVHLQGSGYTVTKITNEGADIITINDVSDVEISGFTIEPPSSREGIYIERASPVIKNNRFSGAGYPIGSSYAVKPIISENIFEGSSYIWMYDTSSVGVITNNKFFLSTGNSYGAAIEALRNKTADISNNIFEGNGSYYSRGVIFFNSGSSSPRTSDSITISGNSITNFGCDGIRLEDYIGVNSIISGNKIVNNTGSGILAKSGIPTISNNIITGNAYGIKIEGNYVEAIVTNNKVTGNTTDVYNANTYPGDTKLNFNVFDTVYGFVPSSLNVKSDGTPW